MATIQYVRGFTHTDWLDNVDRVQAAGSNGFNGRFHSLEAEFDTISGVVAAVNIALVTLGQQPTPQPMAVTFTPTFIATSATPWSHRAGLVEKPAGVGTADGIMNVPLQNGTRILSIRALGRSAQAAGSTAQASLRIVLRRQAVVGQVTSDAIATVALDGPSDPFDITIAATATFQQVDVANFKYFLTADVINAGLQDPVQITAIQISTIAQS
jgi:hypothetical protein